MVNRDTVFYTFGFLFLACALVGCSSLFGQSYSLTQTIGLFLLTSLLAGRWVLNTIGGKKFFVVLILGIIVAFSTYKLKLYLHQVNLILSIIAFFSLSTIEKSEFMFWKKAIIYITLFQAFIVIPTLVPFLKNYFPIFNNEPIGTVGNSDFLATLFASSIFFLKDLRLSKTRYIAFFSLLFLGLLATTSKGTILLFLGIVVFRRWPKMTILAAIPIIAVFIFLFSSSFYGRIQLWVTSLKIWKDHFFLGAGTGQFLNGYFNSNKDLMNILWYRKNFGAWSSEVTDAHNLILQFSSEWGLVGFLIVCTLIFYALKIYRSGRGGAQNVILLSLLKALYTVILPTIQSLLTFSIALSEFADFKKKYRVLSIICFLTVFSLFGFVVTLSLGQFYLKEGLVLAKQGALGPAIVKLNMASSYTPTDVNVLLATAYVYSRSKNCEEASNIVETVTGIQQSMDAYKRGGHILFECRKYEEALKLFRDVHIVFPEHRTTTMKMAWIYYFLSDNTTAKDLAQEVIDIKPRRISFSDERNLKEAQKLLSLIKERRR